MDPSLHKISFTLHVLLRLQFVTIQPVYDYMQAVKWFTAKRCLVKSHSVTVSAEVLV